MANEPGQLVQATGGVWRGCIGTVSHIGKGVVFVDLYRGGGVCLSVAEAAHITVEQAGEPAGLPVEYRDAQVAAVDFFLGAKTAALEMLTTQVEFLRAKREECEDGGYFTDSDRARYGQVADGVGVGIGDVP